MLRKDSTSIKCALQELSKEQLVHLVEHLYWEHCAIKDVCICESNHVISTPTALSWIRAYVNQLDMELKEEQSTTTHLKVRGL